MFPARWASSTRSIPPNTSNQGDAGQPVIASHTRIGVRTRRVAEERAYSGRMDSGSRMNLLWSPQYGRQYLARIGVLIGACTLAIAHADPRSVELTVDPVPIYEGRAITIVAVNPGGAFPGPPPTFAIQGNTIHLYVLQNGFDWGPNPPFSIAWPIGPLAQGTYAVQMESRVEANGPVVASGSLSFVVQSVLPFFDPELYPNPSYAGQTLRFTSALPGGLCNDKVQVHDISIVGNEVTVSYGVEATGPAPCGQSQPAGLDATIGPFTAGQYTVRAVGDYHGTPSASFIVPFSVELAPSSLISYQGLWWNSPAGSEAGWGINFAHQGDVIFATWFTYNMTGKEWWLVMTAERTADNTYAGKLIEPHGPPFDAPQFIPVGGVGGATGSIVGEGTLTFSDANNGTFSYSVNGISQTKAITRQVFGSLPTCIFQPQPDFVRATNMTDLWWAAPAGSESGWGIGLADHGAIFATWFTYDHDNTPLWLVGTLTRDNISGNFTGDLYRTTGPAFNAMPFPPLGAPGGVTGNIVGSATLAFSDGNNAAFTYTVDGTTQSKAITREVFGSPQAVCE